MAGNAAPPRPQRPAQQPQENIEVADMPVPRMSPSLGRFAPAFVRVQAAIQPVIRGRTNPAFKGDRPVTYADLASILEEALPILAANGFGLMQFPSTENNQLALMSMLIHESGEFVSATMPLLLQKADPQGEGSAISYGRRYAACAILGIRTIDDDGNEASNRTPAQRPAQRQPEAPPVDQPKAEGWADAAAESSAHKAAAEQIKQLYALIPDDHPVRAAIKKYRDEHGWPMAANDLMNLSIKVAKAHGEATASAGQEQAPAPAAPKDQPEAAAPAPGAPSAPAAPEEAAHRQMEEWSERGGTMPWDGLPVEASPDSMSVCPWCDKEVAKGEPSVITGGKNPDDPAVRWHKDHYAEMQAENAPAEEQG
jgi:hypothetical protein